MFHYLQRIFKVLVFIFLVASGSILLNYVVISFITDGQIYHEANDLPAYPVILIPGSGDSINNYIFKSRMNAAATLFHTKKIRKIIVSGRDDLPGYDEPGDMMRALIERGIPAEKIEKDYGAKRTLNTIEQTASDRTDDSVIIVSQKSHLERALCIAKAKGLNAAGYIANDSPSKYRRKIYLYYEVFARLRCTLDCLLILIKK